MLKVICRPTEREIRHAARRDLSFQARHWRTVLPFNSNPRGILTHRVRLGGSTVGSDGEHVNDWVHYWCSGQAVGEGLELTDAPPQTRLLCAHCEAKAIAAGEPSADQLCGRHVHIGVVRAKRTCCPDEGN